MGGEVNRSRDGVFRSNRDGQWDPYLADSDGSNFVGPLGLFLGMMPKRTKVEEVEKAGW
jgi:hypothetical protein